MVAVLALVAAACGDDTEPPTGGDSEAPECNADLSVGVAYDIGGIGDKSFNDAANAGLQAAIDEGLVCEENAASLEPDATGSNRDENVLALADDGNDLVIGVGFAFSPGINENAGDYPDTQFADHRWLRDLRDRVRTHERRPHERDGPDLQGARGVVPGGRCGGDQGG